MVVGSKDKRERKKEKERRVFGRLPSIFFPSFCWFHIIVYFKKICLLQISSFFLYFESSNSFEFLNSKSIRIFNNFNERISFYYSITKVNNFQSIMIDNQL